MKQDTIRTELFRTPDQVLSALSRLDEAGFKGVTWRFINRNAEIQSVVLAVPLQTSVDKWIPWKTPWRDCENAVLTTHGCLDKFLDHWAELVSH